MIFLSARLGAEHCPSVSGFELLAALVTGNVTQWAKKGEFSTSAQESYSMSSMSLASQVTLIVSHSAPSVSTILKLAP